MSTPIKQKIIQITTLGKDTLITLTDKGNVFAWKPKGKLKKWIEVEKPKEVSEY